MLDGDLLHTELRLEGHGAWSHQLRSFAETALKRHGDFRKWLNALERLPRLEATTREFNARIVTLGGLCSTSHQQTIRESLQELRPWRKGPFQLFDVELDAEWRSDLKWSRVLPHLDLQGADVLDVGCGNGYYGWRMLGAGARRVVGLEPYPLYNVQHAAVKHFAPDVPNYVIPGTDQLIADRLELFDVVFSMGVFYHCRNPIGHLDALRRALRSGGQLVFETLVVEGDPTTMLLPESRYAKMRNVWCIPSTSWLQRALARCGFSDARVVDVTVTSTCEQRRTEWMTFESLADFLDPTDTDRTVEGYPPPSTRGPRRTSGVIRAETYEQGPREAKEGESGDDGDRTHNLRLARAALSQLSYVPNDLSIILTLPRLANG